MICPLERTCLATEHIRFEAAHTHTVPHLYSRQIPDVAKSDHFGLLRDMLQLCLGRLVSIDSHPEAKLDGSYERSSPTKRLTVTARCGRPTYGLCKVLLHIPVHDPLLYLAYSVPQDNPHLLPALAAPAATMDQASGL